MTTRLLVLQPGPDDPPARLADWLADAGATLDLVDPSVAPIPALADYQGVVCLGGVMGANDDAEHPWLTQVKETLAACVRDRTPLLGICLGAQLLAVATGGEVRRAPDGPEVGTLLVAKRDAATTDPLFAELPMTPDVLQFHSDAITRLPPGAELLAASPKYPNQAFRLGTVAYGVQFHIETTTEIVLQWARSAPDTAAVARPGTLTEAALDQAHDVLAEVWQPFAARFVALVRGELHPAAAAVRSLPMV